VFKAELDVIAADPDYAENLPATVEDWLRITAFGASMARPQEGPRRSSRFAQALYAAGQHTPDGGMADRTYGDALALLGQQGAIE
jgi:hypothetical protein